MQFRSSIIPWLIGGLASLAAAADTIYLANGDRISGELRGIADGSAVLITPYAGEIVVRQDEIVGIDTDAAWYLVLESGESIYGALTWRDGVQMRVSEGELAAVATSAIVRAAQTAEPLAVAAEEPAPAESSAPKLWKGSVELGGAIRSGTTDSRDISGKLSLTRTRPQYALSFSASGLYGEVDSLVNTRRYSGRSELRLTPWERYYVFLYTGAEHDAGRKLDLRWTSGLGMGHDFIKDDRRKLSADLALEFAREWWNPYSLAEEDRVRDAIRTANYDDVLRFLFLLRDTPYATPANARALVQLVSNVRARSDGGDTRREDDVNVRIGANYEQTLFTASRFHAKLALIPEVSTPEDFRFVSDLTWETPLSQALSLRMNWLAEYDSRTDRADISRWENLFTTGLRYAF